jgi:two-component system CheB/CheR fusion protein
MNRLVVIVRDSNDAITVMDFDGRILAWNPDAERECDCIVSEALTMNIRDLELEGQGESSLA